MSAGEFKDHYSVLNASPDTPQNELKKVYFEKLRQFHPDKRPESQGGLGAKVTSELNIAWEVLQDPQKKEKYDAVWRAEQEKKVSPSVRAENRRHEGNALYKQAKEAESDHTSMRSAQEALRLYQAAIEKYTEGIQSNPNDHRLRSNRALCFSALKDWRSCREDAQLVTQMRPDFMKGWFLLVRAHLREGSLSAAQRELDVGLQLLPGNQELLTLQQELTERQGERTGAPGASRGREDVRLPRPSNPTRSISPRNVSPACTPTTPRARSRASTPTRLPTVATGASGSSHSPGPRPRAAPEGTYRTKSRSPGPGMRPAAYFEDTAKFGQTEQPYEQTSNFGGHTSDFGSEASASNSPSYMSRAGASVRPPGGVPPPPPPPPGGHKVPPAGPRNGTQWHDENTPPRQRVGPSPFNFSLAPGGTFADRVSRP